LACAAFRGAKTRHEELESLLRSTTAAAGVAQRARIVLLAAEGVANYEIAERVRVTRPAVNL
jgi:hypothetical protein